MSQKESHRWLVTPREGGLTGICIGGNDGTPCNFCGDDVECGAGKCVSDPVPTVSQLGLVIFTLILLSGT